jgi:pyruvate dehydrogenase complex dehydrogenase (E1) component
MCLFFSLTAGGKCEPTVGVTQLRWLSQFYVTVDHEEASPTFSLQYNRSPAMNFVSYMSVRLTRRDVDSFRSLVDSKNKKKFETIKLSSVFDVVPWVSLGTVIIVASLTALASSLSIGKKF